MKWMLACGVQRREGYHHIDCAPGCRPDEIADLLSPAWWESKENGSVDEIVIEHFLEHVPHQLPDRYAHGTIMRTPEDGLVWFMNECYRVLKSGGTMEVAYPHHQCHAAYSDPTHTRFITEHTFGYFDALLRPVRGHGHYPIGTDFEMSNRKSYGLLDHASHLSHPERALELEIMAREHWNVMWECRIWMTAHKPARQP